MEEQHNKMICTGSWLYIIVAKVKCIISTLRPAMLEI